MADWGDIWVDMKNKMREDSSLSESAKDIKDLEELGIPVDVVSPIVVNSNGFVNTMLRGTTIRDSMSSDMYKTDIEHLHTNQYIRTLDGGADNNWKNSDEWNTLQLEHDNAYNEYMAAREKREKWEKVIWNNNLPNLEAWQNKVDETPEIYDNVFKGIHDKYYDTEAYWQERLSAANDNMNNYQTMNEDISPQGAVTSNIRSGKTKTHSAEESEFLQFRIPEWGYDDFINERAVFQKSLYSPLNEQGWFYFKIFFNFDTQFGLLGGLLNDTHPEAATNTAYKYLSNCEMTGKYDKCADRKAALVKFASILSYINVVAPWFFKGIRNLDKANIPLIDEFSKEKDFEIECNADAIDMRLTTLMDLYKFACFDDVNQKEIVPDNLRKFDMTIMLFQSPLKYFHTATKTLSGRSFGYKKFFDASNFGNMMSFKMFTFINCEIDLESIGNVIPNSISNEKPFTLGNNVIKIKYDRVYTHNMNEFSHMMFGSDGFYYDGNYGYDGAKQSMETQKTRENEIARSYEDKRYHPNTEIYKYLVDASEALCMHNTYKLGLNPLGNIAGSEDSTINMQKINGKLVGTNSDYLNLKLAILKSINDVNVLNQYHPTNTLANDLLQRYVGRIKQRYLAGAEISDINSPEGRRYFRYKIVQMRDRLVWPEGNKTRYDYQTYDYTNFNYEGYYDKVPHSKRGDNSGRLDDSMGSQYFLSKIRKLDDKKVIV